MLEVASRIRLKYFTKTVFKYIHTERITHNNKTPRLVRTNLMVTEYELYFFPDAHPHLIKSNLVQRASKNIDSMTSRDCPIGQLSIVP